MCGMKGKWGLWNEHQHAGMGLEKGFQKRIPGQRKGGWSKDVVSQKLHMRAFSEDRDNEGHKIP